MEKTEVKKCIKENVQMKKERVSTGSEIKRENVFSVLFLNGWQF